MKIKHLSLIIATALFAVSCSSDDDTPDYAAQIAKTYTCSVELSVAEVVDGNYMGMGKTIEITRVNNDSIVAVLALNYKEGSPMGVEKVTAGAKVTYKDGVYTLTGGETVTSTGSYKITATLTGEIDHSEVKLNFSFKPGSMPMKIVAKCSSTNASRTVTIDASDYMKWVYFSFANGVVGTYTIHLDAEGKADGTIVDTKGNMINESSFNWDIALHRYNIKTNDGAVLNTEKTNKDEVTTIPTTGYTKDTEGQITIDISGMMTGGVKTSPSRLNEVLGSWITMKGMPPTYTIPKYVYIIQTKTKEYAKIQLTDNSNKEGEPGYITFNYEYPVK